MQLLPDCPAERPVPYSVMSIFPWRRNSGSAKLSCWGRDIVPRKEKPAMFQLPRRWMLPCLALVTAFGLSAHGQDKPSDLIKEAKQRQEIATQQAELELRASIKQADA